LILSEKPFQVMFGCYFNPTGYYPTSNPTPVLTRVGDGGWVVGVEAYDGHQYHLISIRW